MSDAPDTSYESIYRNTPMAAVAFAAILATGFGSAWAAFAYLPRSEAFVPAVEIAAAMFVLIVGVSVAIFWRHSWTVGASAITIRESHRYLGFWRGRVRVVPFNQIAALRHVESGSDTLLELETLSGERHFLAPAIVKDAAGVPRADAGGFNAFANLLRARIAGPGGQGASFQDGLGFWNKPFGIALLCLALALTTGLSGLILYGVSSGVDMPNGAALQGLALVILLPFFVSYALYRAWERRSFVLGLEALRRTFKPKS